MFVPFDALPGHSRVWVYQADKKFSLADKNIISEALQAFTQEWQVHGMPIETSFNIFYDQFVVLAANDQASGCSIDTSVRTIKILGETLGIDFFNRSQVAFKIGEDILLVPQQELKKTAEQKTWGADTLMFNNIVSSKDELKKNWLIPAKASWLKRYLHSEEAIMR